MTTDPGDLVLDPTCGSGTTAYVAEQWGRRWITIDTSRVPLALARQRLLTATFPYYELKDEARGPAGGFVYKRKQNSKGEEVGGIVPHVTLEEHRQQRAARRGSARRSARGRQQHRPRDRAVHRRGDDPDAGGLGRRRRRGLRRGRRRGVRLVRRPHARGAAQVAGAARRRREDGRRCATSGRPAKTLSLSAEAVVGRTATSEAGGASSSGRRTARSARSSVHEALQGGARQELHAPLRRSASPSSPTRATLVEKCGRDGAAAGHLRAGDAGPDDGRPAQEHAVEPDLQRVRPAGGRAARREAETKDEPYATRSSCSGSTCSTRRRWRPSTATATTCRRGSSTPTTTTSASTSARRSSRARARGTTCKKALKGEYDDSVWDHLAGTVSAPFEAGEHGQIAVKVIDDRGNELLVVKSLRGRDDVIRRVILRRFKRFERRRVRPARPRRPGRPEQHRQDDGAAGDRGLVARAQPVEGAQRLPAPRRRATRRRPIARQAFSAVPLRTFDLLWRERDYTGPVEIEIQSAHGWTVADGADRRTAPSRSTSGRSRRRAPTVVRDARADDGLRPADDRPEHRRAGLPAPEDRPAPRPGQARRHAPQPAGRGAPARERRGTALAGLDPAAVRLRAAAAGRDGRRTSSPSTARAPGGPRFDIASAGSGFQQVLMLLTFLNTRPGVGAAARRAGRPPARDPPGRDLRRAARGRRAAELAARSSPRTRR